MSNLNTIDVLQFRVTININTILANCLKTVISGYNIFSVLLLYNVIVYNTYKKKNTKFKALNTVGTKLGCNLNDNHVSKGGNTKA